MKQFWTGGYQEVSMDSYIMSLVPDNRLESLDDTLLKGELIKIGFHLAMNDEVDDSVSDSWKVDVESIKFTLPPLSEKLRSEIIDVIKKYKPLIA